MKSNNRNWMLALFLCAGGVVLANHVLAADTGNTHRVGQGENAKVSGLILARDGDLIRVREKKSNEVVAVRIGATTKVERSKSRFPFYRRVDMDVTALLPGLTVEAEGVGNPAGELDAQKISFNPDDFAIEVAEQQQVAANRAAAEHAQASADQAAKQASQAQIAADQAQNSPDSAQSSADRASATTQTAGALGLVDAAAIDEVNQRVSGLDQYENKFEVDVFFPEGSTRSE